ALPEVVARAADRSAVTRIANDAIQPVIEPILKVTWPGMRIARRPAGEQCLAHVRFTVTVCVFQKERVRRLMDDDSTVGKSETGRDAQFVGKDGDLVGPAVAVGVLADEDAIASLALGLLLVGIVDVDSDPEAAALVPVHADRLAPQLRLRHKELHLETDRMDVVLDGLRR